MSLTTRGAEIKFSNISHLFLILPTTRTEKEENEENVLYVILK